jgi:hypothetical protein
MRTLTHKDIQALAHGESIPRFVAKIKRVWEQKSGPGEYGTWYLQNIIVMMDEADGEVNVTWTGEDAFERSWEGKTVEFSCAENKQGRLVGVMRDVRTGKDGNVYKGVKVTPAGVIKRLDQGDLPERSKPAANGERTARAPAPDETAAAATAGDKIEAYAKHARRVFFAAWAEAEEALNWMLTKEDREKMTLAEIYDLQLRIAQNFAIEINKVIRKERF